MFVARVAVSDRDLKDINPDSQLYQRAVDTLRDAQQGAEFVAYARATKHECGELEFDTDAACSRADDGAYVMGWVWISDAELQEWKNTKGAPCS